MHRLRILLTTTLLTSLALAGCLSEDPDDGPGTGGVDTTPGITTVQERESLEFDITNPRSLTLVPGPYEILDALSVFVDVPLPPTEGVNTVNPVVPPQAHLGLFLPDIEGCDWSAASLPEECHVPVIADVGPYYEDGDVAATTPANRLGAFLIENFVPHGYAVAQVSVMGSGQATHCFDMFGLAEQLGVHHSVEWLGSQPWSNGAVGLIGRSYDGSTPWMAAAHGSEYLKTIIPISGLSGLGDLVQWNGAAETRILTFHNVIYGTFGIDIDPADPAEAFFDAFAHASCPDYVTAVPWGAASYASGDDVVDQEGTYWQERHFIPGTLENYDGSLYMIHGLQDGNVEPHAGWIGELALRDNGNDVKAMWGQWAHMYPDTVNEHGFGNWHPDSIRMDWAQDLLEWFDHYLKGTGPQPLLTTEIQQLDGAWRSEPVWPPEDANIVDIPLTGDSFPVSITTGPTDINLGVISDTEATLMSGFSTVTLTVIPQGPGGVVGVQLRNADGDFGLSWGVMDLRYASGSQQPVAPGQAMQVTIPFTIFDAELAAGDDLILRVASSMEGFGGLVPVPVTVDPSGSTLHLSTLDRDDSFYFQPPTWYYYNNTCELFQIGNEDEGSDDVPASGDNVEACREQE